MRKFHKNLNSNLNVLFYLFICTCFQIIDKNCCFQILFETMSKHWLSYTFNPLSYGFFSVFLQKFSFHFVIAQNFQKKKQNPYGLETGIRNYIFWFDVRKKNKKKIKKTYWMLLGTNVCDEGLFNVLKLN